MFAYVKYRATCPRHEDKKIVPVSEIRNFDSKNIANRNKSYNIKCGESYCAAIIIFTDETEKGLHEKIAAKRHILPPKDLIESASDLDILTSGAKQQAAREKKGERVKTLLNEKLNTLQNKVPRKIIPYPAAGRNKTSNANVSKKRAVNILQDQTNIVEERCAVKRKNPECRDTKIKKLTDEIRDLNQKCSKYEHKITEQKVMIKDLTQLNMELQRDIIEYFEDFKAMAKQYEGAIRNLEGADTPPIGYIQKSSNKVHLGHNIWIDKGKYEDIVGRSKTYQLFVKNMAIAVFGFEILETSSVTGARSNKFPDRPAKPKLDETKILAIHDIFQHWLQTKKNLTPYEAHVEASKTRLYISRKISDLNRPVGINKKGSSATDNSNAVTDEAGGSIEVDSEADGSIEADNEAYDPEETHDEVDSLDEDYDENDDLTEQADCDMDDLGDSDDLIDQEVDKNAEIESDSLRPEKERSEPDQRVSDTESAELKPDKAKGERENMNDLVVGTDAENENSTEIEDMEEPDEQDE